MPLATAFLFWQQRYWDPRSQFWDAPRPPWGPRPCVWDWRQFSVTTSVAILYSRAHCARGWRLLVNRRELWWCHLGRVSLSVERVKGCWGNKHWWEGDQWQEEIWARSRRRPRHVHFLGEGRWERESVCCRERGVPTAATGIPKPCISLVPSPPAETTYGSATASDSSPVSWATPYPFHLPPPPVSAAADSTLSLQFHAECRTTSGAWTCCLRHVTRSDWIFLQVSLTDLVAEVWSLVNYHHSNAQVSRELEWKTESANHRRNKLELEIAQDNYI